MKSSKYKSTLQAAGNFSGCRSAALLLLQKGKEKCAYERCYIGSTFMPKLQGKLLATENFFYTSKFFGLGKRASLSDLMMAGEHFCGEDWSILKRKHPLLDEEDLMRYCFSSSYIVAMLHDSLGIAMDEDRVVFANHVGEISLDWALGAFIMQSTAKMDIHHHDWVSSIMSDESLTYLVCILVILMFMTLCISQWPKPQMKTVFDLEKGRYIISRVNR